MFFSPECIKTAYAELIKLDPSTGKARQEKVSALRHLLAVSHILRTTNKEHVDLSVGSEERTLFVEAVGDVVALDTNGLYTKDFANDITINNKDTYSVSSNFLTTRLKTSRQQRVMYPGRPLPILRLEEERAFIVEDVEQKLLAAYGVGNIKAALCVWLLRNKEIVSVDHGHLQTLLNDLYTPEITNAIVPSEQALQTFVASVQGNCLTVEKPEILNAIGFFPTDTQQSILDNDLTEDDPIFVTISKLLERESKAILFLGPPGTSKTWYALKIALKLTDGEQGRVKRVQFHPSFAYEDFVEGLVATGSISGTEPLFKPKDKIFLTLCENAWQDTDNRYILVIDEFSRGDPSRIFGELLTYIEPDYREIPFRLPYSEREVSIPHNIIILATMNPYDKSVIELDSAMERRFDVIELSPSETTLRQLVIHPEVEKIVTFFNLANERSPHGFGHTYFKDVEDDDDLILLWNHKLKFIFEKMFRFNKDVYAEIRGVFVDILTAENRDKIA